MCPPGARARAWLPSSIPLPILSTVLAGCVLAGCVAPPPARVADGNAAHEEVVAGSGSIDRGVAMAAPDGPRPHSDPYSATGDQAPGSAAVATSASHARPDDDATIERDTWERIRQGLSLPHPLNKRVMREVRWYGKNQKYIDRVAERARPYLPYIVRQLEQRDLPMEFALLPVVESAFQVSAYSRARALGLWQFIPSTGRLYGLEQNWWYDGRRDAIASTDAALDYLSKLLDDFDGDRLLAVAAYNWGEGNVMRAMSRNRARGKPTDVWSLKLPRETRAHVSRLLAFAAIVEDPGRHGMVLDSIHDRVAFETVPLDGQIDLAVAARLAGITLDEIHQLNSGFKRNATAPNGPHRLHLPTHAVERFRTNLASSSVEERLRWTRHRIVRGDTLGTIAGRYRTTVAVLKRLNRLTSDRIVAGQHLLIPKATDAFETLRIGEVTGVDHAAAPAARTVHVVESGDTLSGIATRHGTTVLALAQVNGINRNAILHPGQKLRLIPAVYSRPTAEHKPIHYRVKRGDSLWKISRRFGVSVASLREWNQLPEGELLMPGRKLEVHVALPSSI